MWRRRLTLWCEAREVHAYGVGGSVHKEWAGILVPLPLLFTRMLEITLRWALTLG